MDSVVNARQTNSHRRLLRRLFIRGRGLSYYGIADWFLLGLFVLPTYFGVRLGFFDLTALRFFEILLVWCIFKDRKRKKQLFTLIKSCQHNVWVWAYMLVVLYTNLIHPSINTIFYWITNGIIVFYCVAYLVVYEYGIDGFLNKLRQFAWIVSVISPLELVIGRPPFAFLDTLGKSNTNARFGSVRIMGNCTTTNGFAMYLMILFPLMCYDWEKRRIDLGKNKWLLLLMGINIFLTGSRLTVGTFVLGLFLCFIFQKRKQLAHSIIVFLVAIPIVVFTCFIFKDVEFVRNLLRTFFSAVDEILGSSYALYFGANAQTLYNSSYYRELLWQNTILGDWLNPWLGRGGNYNFAMYIEGYYILSCDNFYVGQYITYAWPGVITWLLMSGSFLVSAIKQWVRKRNRLMLTIIVSIVCYFISLWYLDQLQTFPFMIAVFGLIYGAWYLENKRNSV